MLRQARGRRKILAWHLSHSTFSAFLPLLINFFLSPPTWPQHLFSSFLMHQLAWPPAPQSHPLFSLAISLLFLFANIPFLSLPPWFTLHSALSLVLNLYTQKSVTGQMVWSLAREMLWGELWVARGLELGSFGWTCCLHIKWKKDDVPSMVRCTV